jgi:hypothetical protein
MAGASSRVLPAQRASTIRRFSPDRIANPPRSLQRDAAGLEDRAKGLGRGRHRCEGPGVVLMSAEPTK